MRIWLMFLGLLGVIVGGGVLAQVPLGTKLHKTSMTFYRDTPTGKKLDFVVTGNGVSNISARVILVNQFEMKNFRNGDPKDTQIIAEAPQCELEMLASNNIASDAGPLQVYTPTRKLFVQGVGFIFVQSNHFLLISNQVETRVVKSLLKTSVLAATKTNELADTNQVLKIFAQQGRFNFEANLVDYAGSVHLIDPQLDMTCDFMTIRFGSNGAVESMLARKNVVLNTTKNGRATGATGFYYVTNNHEMMRLTTDATWHNNDQEAKAHEFTYDSTLKYLTGTGQVKVRWPDKDTNSTGTHDVHFREIFADSANMQFPLTNGPVQNMHARGNVIIYNEADGSRAMGETADYDRVSDRVVLSGHPEWWNNKIDVKAELLSAELGGKTYHALTNAHFKMLMGKTATNQWLYISSDDMVYETTRARFFRNVETRLVQNESTRDTLDCALLTLNLTNNQVESAFAAGEVRGRTAPDPAGLFKTIACEELNAYIATNTGWLKTVDAHTNVVLEQQGTTLGGPANRLRTDTLNARFSLVTNRLEEAVAESNVVLDQTKPGAHVHATSERAVYTVGLSDVVKLTGHPLARDEKHTISNADYMTWEPKLNKFQAYGRYNLVNNPITAVSIH